ncbi:MAG TPA: multicopper oxidase family protein [Candidatus Baltobacteraceae bacterium]|jgi:FtsP/CotA-like multicopper oxidase with cupredoxin domain
MRRFTLVIAAIFALVSCGGGGGSATHSPGGGSSLPSNPTNLPSIPEVDSVNGVAALTLTAQYDSNSRPAFFYNGAEVAPTIRVHPGDTIQLTYVNNLPEFCGVGIVSNSNLHFHGLTTSPNQPGDEVILTNAAPGSSYTYSVKIDTDQPPGMYWYHPHPHGLTNWEIGNGMGGAIVIEGIADEIPSLAGLRERVIVLRDVFHDPAVSVALGDDVARRKSRIMAYRHTLDDEGGGGPGSTSLCQPEGDKTPTINGVQTASIGIQPGEKQLWRVLNASGVRHFDLYIPGVQLQLVAQDGVPLQDYTGAGSTQSLTVNDIVIPPAGRAEFIVTGPSAAAPLISKCYDAGPIGDPNPQVTLGQLYNDYGATSAVRVAKPMGLRMRQAYRVAPPAPSAFRTVHLQENSTAFYINGQAYDPAASPMYTVHIGTTEQWTIENDTDEVHAFHTHQVHFVVLSSNGIPNPTARWLDTVDVPAQSHGGSGAAVPTTVTLLVDFRDAVIAGTFLFHCHITDHEDGGMMAKITAQ